jgi:hypothetical protein
MKNFKIKAAVAAAALATTGMASAGFNSNDLAFVAYNYTSGESYILDTGISFASIASGGSITLGQAGNNTSAFSTFLTDVGSNFVWGAQAINGTANVSVFTAPTSTVVGATQAFSNVGIGAYYSNYTSIATSGGLVTNASNVGGVILKTSNAGQGTNWGGDNFHNTLTNIDNFSNGDSPWVITQTGAGTLDIYSFTLGTGRGAANNSALLNTITLAKDALTGVYTLNVGAVVTGAVPEPGTYALMLAGLLAVGAVTRRRLRG